MPKGMITARWDDRLGVVLESAYPQDITQGFTDDDFLTIFSTHAMSEQAGILSMRIKRFSIVSYYTGIPESERESQFYVALVLEEQENPNDYEESLTEIAKMIIPAIGKPGFDDFYLECFNRVSKMKEITEEQRYAFIFRDKVRRLMLDKLADGSMTKEGLAKWLSKEVESEVTDIDGLLAPLMKTDLVTELNISKGKKVSLEYVFLLRDVALIRTPHVEHFKAAKSGQMLPELSEKYQKKVEEFFKEYRITSEDTGVIADFVSNPDTYDIIKVLREAYVTREEIPMKVGRDLTNLDNNLKDLAEENIILPIKDKKGRVWILLLSNITPITFYPEYMIDVIRRRWKEGTIAKEIALKHLELLRAEYISTQAPKYRKKIFEKVDSNYKSAEDSIHNNKLDEAAKSLEVCSNLLYDMGERKLGELITNSAKLIREDKEKYIEEDWDEDRGKILELLEVLKQQIEEAKKEKGAKKKKELKIKEEKAGVSEKAEILEKEEKGKEIHKKVVEEKEAFTLADSFTPPPVKKEPSPELTPPPMPEAKSEPEITPPKPEIKPPEPAPPSQEQLAPEPTPEPEVAPFDINDIKSIEAEIKKAKKKKDAEMTVELLGLLAEAYKRKGDLKKVDQVYVERNTVTINFLIEKRNELEKQAKKAEKNKDWQTAADLYGQCKDLSSQLFKAGQMSEADNVKNFTSKQSHCLSELES